MMTNHPITPPPELVQQWVSLACEYEGNETWIDLATQAAQWGADQKLEACCKWLEQLEPARDFLAMQLRAANPPTLKQQALAELEILSDYTHGLGCSESAIRRALEALPND